MIEIPEYVFSAINRLNESGYEAWLVGGCVRDMLLGLNPNDWDITTNARPNDIISAFSDYAVVPTGIRHGTVTVIISEHPMEVTTYRIDGEYTDNRHPSDVLFTDLLSEDLKRRDFTVNAMAYHPKFGVKDFNGGIRDLENHMIKCVGEADIRFNEDALRILRALRFASVYGFVVEANTSESIHKNKELLKNISAERIQSELTKLLCGSCRNILMEYSDVFGVIIPEIIPMFGFDQKSRYHIFDVWEHTVEVLINSPSTSLMRWTALLHDIGKPLCFSIGDDGQGHFYGHASISADIAESVATRLRFDNSLKSNVTYLIKHHCDAVMTDRKHIKKLMSKMGKDNARHFIELGIADNLAQAPIIRDRQVGFSEALKMIDDIESSEDCFSLKQLAVTGNDLQNIGLKGREIGSALEKLLDAVINEKTENRKDAIIRYYIDNIKSPTSDIETGS